MSADIALLSSPLPSSSPPPPYRTGELTNRLSSDTQVVQNAVTNNINMLARYTLQMVFSVGLMFYLSAKLTAVLLSVVPLIAVSAVQYGEYHMILT